MSLLNFTRSELTAAIARGVRQCVVIGSRLSLPDALKSSQQEQLELFTVDEEKPSDSLATFVPTEFCCETLSTALEKSSFDKLKATLFVWGGAGYRTVDAVMESLSFIASLPRGSGVVFDYTPERITPGPLVSSALDALASRIRVAGGNVKHLIQPQAVAAMLKGVGFQKIEDSTGEESPGISGHFVSAVV